MIGPAAAVAGLVGLGWPIGVAVVGPMLFDDFALSVGLSIAFLGVVAVGFSLMLELGGMLSFAQGTFAGIGMYAVMKSPWDGVASLGFALVSGAAAILVLSPLILRLREIYFALGTIAVALIAEGLARGLSRFGGPSGLSVSVAPPFGLATTREFFIVGWIFVFVVVLAAHRLRRSRFGLSGLAVAHDPALAEAVGASPNRVRLTVFAMASLTATLAGAIYAHYLLSVAPPVLGVLPGIEVAVASALGGAAPGATVVGMAVIRLLPEVGVSDPALYLIVLGSVLAAIILWAPRGLRLPFASVRARFRPPAERRSDGVRTEVRPAGRSDEGTAARHGETVLEARDLKVAFGGLKAVDGVSLSVARGEVVGLIGPNGAGKTTFFNLLTGAVPAQGGSVHLSGHDISAWAVSRRAQAGLGRTFQIPKTLHSATVLESVTLGAFRLGGSGAIAGMTGLDAGERRRLTAVAWDALDRVGLTELANQPVDLLGTGRRKLLEVARALASQPTVLLLDEPGGGLESAEVQELARVVRLLATGDDLAIVVIEHEMDFVMEVSDRVAVMESGKLLAIAPPDQVRQDPEVLRAYLG